MKSIKKAFWLFCFGFSFFGVINISLLLGTGSVIHFGSYFLLISGVILAPLSLYKIKHDHPLISYKPLRKIILTLVSFGVIFFLFLQSLILFGLIPDKVEQVDYLIILGAGLKGEILTVNLYNRLVTGLEVLNNNPDLSVVVTGGMGKGESITEATAMKTFLMKNGIPESRIIVEEEATSTYENLLYSKMILENADPREEYKIILITNGFHMFRSKMLAKRFGFIPYGLPSKSYPWTIPNDLIRESFAIVNSYFFHKP